MKKTQKILLFIAISLIAIILKSNKVQATEYKWPIGGENANETYIDYEFYGNRNTTPIKDGKSGREYIVNNQKWPEEQYYYASCESHYGMDITGIYGHTYSVISVVDGTVIATSADKVINPSVNYVDRNQRRTSAGLKDGGGYGNYIIIQEPSTGRCFLYAHLKGGSLKVSKGSTVTVGQEIATMGSSGDAGHMHLHFEIRKSKSVMITENRYGRHYLVNTTSYTNLDPKDYIGSGPDLHTPYPDTMRVQISKEDAQYYMKYLYRTVLQREASDEEAEHWANIYIDNGSIYHVTQGVFLSPEASMKMGDLNNSDFVRKAFSIILYRGDNYSETEIEEYISNLDKGIWNRRDFLTMLCNCDEFVNSKLSSIISHEKPNTCEIEGLATPDQLKDFGDLNADGLINSIDASLCLQMAARGTASCAYAEKYADLDNDGRVSASDAYYILRYSSEVGAGNIDSSTKSILDFVNELYYNYY